MPSQTRKYNELSRLAYTTGKAGRLMAEYEKDTYTPCWEKLKEIKAPMLFLFGRHDTEIRPENAASLMPSLRNAEMVVFTKSGHDIFSDEPAKFATAVNQFIVRIGERFKMQPSTGMVFRNYRNQSGKKTIF